MNLRRGLKVRFRNFYGREVTRTIQDVGYREAEIIYSEYSMHGTHVSHTSDIQWVQRNYKTRKELRQ